jgi:hypothetical protein
VEKGKSVLIVGMAEGRRPEIKYRFSFIFPNILPDRLADECLLFRSTDLVSFSNDLFHIFLSTTKKKQL